MRMSLPLEMIGCTRVNSFCDSAQHSRMPVFEVCQDAEGPFCERERRERARLDGQSRNQHLQMCISNFLLKDETTINRSSIPSMSNIPIKAALYAVEGISAKKCLAAI